MESKSMFISRNFLFYIIFSLFFFSCSSDNEKPSTEVMKEALVKELGSSVKIIGYEHQDGVLKVVDGVKYYDAFFNAEVKFLSNVGNKFQVGDEYKLLKVSVHFMKTENGWNCLEYDWSNSRLIKLNKNSNEESINESGQNFKSDIESSVIDSVQVVDSKQNKSEPSSNNLGLYNSYNGQEYNGFINSRDVKIKINWKSDKTITAIYYFVNDPENIYSWTGSNFNDGELQIIDYYGDVKNGQGKLRKSTSNTSINWIGEIYNDTGEKINISIKRPR